MTVDDETVANAVSVEVNFQQLLLLPGDLRTDDWREFEFPPRVAHDLVSPIGME